MIWSIELLIKLMIKIRDRGWKTIRSMDYRLWKINSDYRSFLKAKKYPADYFTLDGRSYPLRQPYPLCRHRVPSFWIKQFYIILKALLIWNVAFSKHPLTPRSQVRKYRKINLSYALSDGEVGAVGLPTSIYFPRLNPDLKGWYRTREYSIWGAN